MAKTNQDFIDEQCVGNDYGVLVVSTEDKKITCKSYHEKFLNSEFACHKNSLSQADTIFGVPPLMDKDMVVTESTSKMK